jgi:hypothetical protein
MEVAVSEDICEVRSRLGAVLDLLAEKIAHQARDDDQYRNAAPDLARALLSCKRREVAALMLQGAATAREWLALSTEPRA